jgi:hypothetical protein
MTTGIGNPDWQRRYAFSATPLFSSFFAVSGPIVSPVLDANGFPYIILTSKAGGTTAFIHFFINWYQDAAGTILLGGTDFVTVPGASETIKCPAMARYFTILTQNVGGGTTGTTLILVYGTVADQYDMMTGTTSVPLAAVNASLGAGVSQQVAFPHVLQGRVYATFNHGTNNNWLAFFDYYDFSATAWVTFYNVRGLDKGESWSEQLWLPSAPCRATVRNTDAAAQVTQMYVITADTP